MPNVVANNAPLDPEARSKAAESNNRTVRICLWISDFVVNMLAVKKMLASPAAKPN